MRRCTARTALIRGVGVFGNNTGNTGGFDVYGRATAADGTGVFGVGDVGVEGFASNPTSTQIGVKGVADLINGTGVQGSSAGFERHRGQGLRVRWGPRHQRVRSGCIGRDQQHDARNGLRSGYGPERRYQRQPLRRSGNPCRRRLGRLFHQCQRHRRLRKRGIRYRCAGEQHLGDGSTWQQHQRNRHIRLQHQSYWAVRVQPKLLCPSGIEHELDRNPGIGGRRALLHGDERTGRDSTGSRGPAPADAVRRLDSPGIREGRRLLCRFGQPPVVLSRRVHLGAAGVQNQAHVPA
jgi:hypothetical protein